MKTILEVMNMNATYEVRSQHSVDFQRSVIVIRRSILSIAHKLIGRMFIIIHYKTLKSLLNEFKIKSFSASKEM